MTELAEDLLAQAGKLVFYLNAARKKARLLPASHPYVQDAGRQLNEALGPLLDQLPVVTLSVLDDELYVEGQLMPEESLTYGELIAELSQRGLKAVSFRRGISCEELTNFVGLTNLKRETIDQRGGWDEILRKEQIHHATLERMPVLGGPGAEEESQVETAAVPQEMYRWALETVIAAFGEVRDSRRLDVALFGEVINALVASVLDNADVLQALSTIKNVHQYTFYHSVNVSILSLLMGLKLQLDPSLLYKLGVAAILHDIGKMRVPEEILSKPGELTRDEWEMMQSHSIEGARILSEQPQPDVLAMVVAAQHHARHDLSGYPRFDGLDRLHLLSEVVAVADAYDALTSDRSYRNSMLADRAMQLIIEGRGTYFDPVLVKVFAQLCGLFPVGTLVELDTGELAVVLRPNPEDLCRPRVKLAVTGAREPKEFSVVDLTELSPGDGFKRSILRSVSPAECGINTADFFI